MPPEMTEKKVYLVIYFCLSFMCLMMSLVWFGLEPLVGGGLLRWDSSFSQNGWVRLLTSRSVVKTRTNAHARFRVLFSLHSSSPDRQLVLLARGSGKEDFVVLWGDFAATEKRTCCRRKYHKTLLVPPSCAQHTLGLE